MTGRDLIVYILTNHLENAEIRNGKLMVSGNDFMKDEQVASIASFSLLGKSVKEIHHKIN